MFQLLGSLLFGLMTTGHAAYQYETGRAAIDKMAGCYLIDYSYAETESLKPGYVRDNRIYDVNTNKSVKEWIYREQISENHVRLQHILFATDLNGNYMEGSVLKHQAEDWIYDAKFYHEFVGPSTWKPITWGFETTSWTRRVTNLDDGLRYQCVGQWKLDTVYPEWTCSNYAPIPGRETRDMGRKDYNTLDRTTRIVVYGNSWLERQNNVKTIHGEDGQRTPLARELGKNWYVRLPDSECAPVQDFVRARQSFWTLLRETWEYVFLMNSLSGKDFVEVTPQGQPPRFAKMMEIEEKYMSQDLSDNKVAESARTEIYNLIEAYRKH